MAIDKTLQEALKHHQSGNLQHAEYLYKEILNIQHNNFYALHYLGVLYCQLGNYGSAIDLIKKALEVNPSDNHAYYNLGISLHGKGLLDEAKNAYQKAIKLNPMNADAYLNLGIIFKEKGIFDEAITCYQTALKLNPELVAAYNNLGIVLKEKGQLDEALACFEKSKTLNPNNADIYANLANVFHAKGQLDEAVNSYQKALQINHLSAEIYINFGIVLSEQGKQEEALSAFNCALELNPDNFIPRFAQCILQLPIIYQEESSIYISRKRYHNELIKLQNTIPLETPQDIKAASEAVGIIQPFYLPYQGFNDRELQQIYGNIICRIMAPRYPQFSERPSMPPLLSEQPLRVGFVSGYFYNHSVWKIPIKGWIENIDKQRFKLYGYYTWKKKDEETELAKHYFKHFVEDTYSFEKLCNTIRKDNLHILIYPEIGMDPISLKLASLRLAPVQCVSWGHPETSGLPTIDYYLSSDLMEPPDADEHYTEKLIRLPNLSFYHIPTDIRKAPVNRSTFNLRSDSIVYHCCQSLYKYLPQYDELFPRIAQKVKNCQFIFSSHPKSSYLTEQFHTRIKNVFKKFNLNIDDFAVFLPFLDVLHYNTLYFLADVFLDPIGWSGCNSALEAISCNLPIITLPGKLMRSRDSFAILTMMEVKETVASSLDEYISLSVRLGKEHDLRQDISNRIEENKHRIYYDRAPIIVLEEFFEKVVKENCRK